jgi:beta-lactamase superfamily II metal-dependent hydrolase
MTCELTFLPVGNADCIILRTDNSTVIVDIGKPRLLVKWLKSKEANYINRIYITHAHGDHCPSIIKLVEFLKIWLKSRIKLEIILPYRLYQTAIENLLNQRKNNSINKSIEQMEQALNEIDQWDKLGTLIILPIARNSEKYQDNFLNISALHPRLPFVDKHLAKTKSKLNEISLILRVNYGEFSAILLADIEGDGLTELVNIYQDNVNQIESELKANLVKIPHHGAYPKNGEELEKLLKMIDAEIAVLSVGSTNTYNHVKPELFALLSQLENDQKLALNKFICTEVTKTCVYPIEKCQKMGKQGLSETKKCAGEITIIAKTSGEWELKTETNHHEVISELSDPACQNIIDNNGL